MRLAWLLAFFFFAAAVPAVKAQNEIAQRSFFSLPFSNGYSSAVYDVNEKALVAFTDMIEWYERPSRERKSFIRRVYPGLRYKEKTVWLCDVEPKSIGYLNESGIVHVAYDLEGNRTDCYYFAPFTAGKHTIAIVCNTDADEVLLHAELLSPEVKITKSTKGNSTMILLSIEPVKDISLEKEKKFWEDFHSIEPKVDPRYEKLFRQSTTFLKMGQSAESGAILAGLLPGRWTICWVRDCCYSIKALVDSNHFTEAKKGLEFLLNGKAGEFEHFYYNGKDYGVGEDYLISACRYFGDGTEWSDDIDQQEPEPIEGMKDPNIELDGFGLFLWAANEYVKKSEDYKFLSENINKFESVGQNILHSIDHMNLIKADSSIWERHLSRANHYIYTSITCAEGLRGLSQMCEKSGADGSAYTKGYAQLKSGINACTDSKGALMGNLEEKEYHDAAVVEAINFGLVNESVAKNTMNALERELFNGKGFKRNDDGDWYDEQEWVFIDLRAAESYLRLGEPEGATELLDRVKAISEENFNIIAELYDKDDNCAGQVPMCGYGAGVFVSTSALLKNS
jgi:GH15 family glucan-1,4-alpha-glucosidase